MDRLNILFIRNSFKIHGPGTHAFNYAKELRSRGHKIVFCGATGELDDLITHSGFKKITVEGLENGKRKSFFENAKDIRAVLIDEKIDVVIGFNAFSIVNAIAANLFRRKVVFIDIVVGEGKEKMLRFIPCKYIAISEHSYNRLRSFKVPVPKNNIVYPSTINLKDFDLFQNKTGEIREEFGIKKDEVMVINVAMFNDLKTKMTKGQKHIIQILPKLISSNEKIKFIFVGDGPMRGEIEEKSIRLGLDKKVIFAGKRTDIPSMMYAADIFCHYPDQETFGMVITEAMAGYTPVVARSIGGMTSIVENGKSGYLVSDLDNFLNKILYLSRDPQMRKSMGEYGRKLVEEKFTLEKVVDKLEQVIDLYL